MPLFYPRVSHSSKSSSSGAMWKCAFCGAMNEDENLVCDGCGDERPSGSAASSPIGSKFDKREDFEDMGTSTPPQAPSKSLDQSVEEEDENLEVKDEESDKDEFAESDTSDADTESGREPFGLSTPSTSDDDDISKSGTLSPDFSADSVITSPPPSSSTPSTSSLEEPEPVSSSYSPPSPPPSPQPNYSPRSSSSSAFGQRYYLVFVNTPAQALIKSRVSVDFDDFPVISIGRNPENVVVIPDQEVSRKHAELATENGKLVLRDLKSANGTYLYDGKQFNRVNGSVEVKPNSILKFGTGTIVRLENG